MQSGLGQHGVGSRRPGALFGLSSGTGLGLGHMLFHGSVESSVSEFEYLSRLMSTMQSHLTHASQL